MAGVPAPELPGQPIELEEQTVPKKNTGSTPHPQNKAQRRATTRDAEVVDRLGGKNPVVDPTDDVQESLATWRDGVDNPPQG